VHDHQVTIRLSEEALAFVYTVRVDGTAVEAGTVEVEETVAPGYYGGSESMD
jgi:hypothetical protein